MDSIINCSKATNLIEVEIFTTMKLGSNYNTRLLVFLLVVTSLEGRSVLGNMNIFRVRCSNSGGFTKKVK